MPRRLNSLTPLIPTGVCFRDVSHDPQPNSKARPAAHKRTMPESGSITLSRSNRSRLFASNFIPCEAASSTLKSGHLLARLRERWFLSDHRSVARSPSFSSWLAARFVSGRASPLRRRIHRRANRPALSVSTIKARSESSKVNDDSKVLERCGLGIMGSVCFL